MTKMAMLRTIDAALVRAYASEIDASFFSEAYEALYDAARELHGCDIMVTSNAVYEMRKTFGVVSVMPTDEMTVKARLINAWRELRANVAYVRRWIL